MGDGRLELQVSAEERGSRLDHFLVRHLAGNTRSALRRMILGGRVVVEGQPVTKPGLNLRGGMRVEIDLPELPPLPQPESIPLHAVYEDEHLIVLDKPAGLVVHPGSGRRCGTLVNALIGRGTSLASAGAPDRPGIVHRLDQGTSGLLVVAKTDAAHGGLTSAFSRREVHKRYVALAWGRMDPAEGTVERGIGRSRTDRRKMSVAASRTRAAVTRYRTVEALRGFALLDVIPLTGRTHQIRVHLQSIQHPIVGDERYGGRPWRGVQDPQLRMAIRDFDRLALHAAELAFVHPATGRELRCTAPLPADFWALLEMLRSR